jgi:hypothetical protein
MKIIGSDTSRQSFKELKIHSFDELIAEIESGLIVCPMPSTWVQFYDHFIAHEDPNKRLLPLILGSWRWTPDEEKNERLKLQITTLEVRYNKIEFNSFNWKNAVFDWFDNHKSCEILVNENLFKSKFDNF